MINNMTNKLWYLYKRYNWVFDISRFWSDFEHIQINKPIFLLGVHGGGLTLVSRMLRRNKDVVSVTGNYKYWSGADEMEIVLGSILPFELTGTRHKAPSHSIFNCYTKNWVYATNEMFPFYRKTEEDVTPELRHALNKIIRWLISKNAVDKSNVRFTDKSQVYTLRVSFINEILKNTDPKFILVVRNPYAMCLRAVNNEPALLDLKKTLSEDRVLEYAAQHWINSIKCALNDSNKVRNFYTVRFEDILKRPQKELKKICHFAEVEYNNDMIPQKYHKIPFGSRYLNDKWYPLRANVNKRYLDMISEEQIKIINKYCFDYIKFLGYNDI